MTENPSKPQSVRAQKHAASPEHSESRLRHVKGFDLYQADNTESYVLDFHFHTLQNYPADEMTTLVGDHFPQILERKDLQKLAYKILKTLREELQAPVEKWNDDIDSLKI
ncbi:MAG: hypothetical protein OXG06_02105 [Gammaproteobacteria bacterium]|nr:hypothetical protein [Gammaproteobacteria bacterium]